MGPSRRLELAYKSLLSTDPKLIISSISTIFQGMNDYVVEDLILKLEELVQRDEGGRGIKDIMLQGQLALAAKKVIDSIAVVIITGFPCLLDYDIPTETDGPLGALAIAKSCLALGKRVAILTDDCNQQVVTAAIEAHNAHMAQAKEYMDTDEPINADSRIEFRSFPPGPSFTDSHRHSLEEFMMNYDTVIAIERPGPSRSGQYFTMRKRDMTGIVSPLDQIITFDKVSIGIGDGGNEVGIGKVYDKMITSSIPYAPDIACVTATDYLIVASVSNWGGYALSAAVAALIISNQTARSEFNNREIVDLIVSSIDEQIAICQSMVDAGARDGISAKCELSVDGMPLDVSLDVLKILRELVITYI
jgi:D-glutamate cyclase